MRASIPARATYLSGTVTPLIRTTLRRLCLDFGDELFHKNDELAIDGTNHQGDDYNDPVETGVGAVNLALVSRQEQREEDVESEKTARRAERRTSKRAPNHVHNEAPADVQEQSQNAQMDVPNGVLDNVNRAKRQRKSQILDAMVDIYVDSPDTGPTEMAKQLGIGRSTVYTYLADLETAGRIDRNNGDGIAVTGK
jgi:predicted transcriptional regulator